MYPKTALYSVNRRRAGNQAFCENTPIIPSRPCRKGEKARNSQHIFLALKFIVIRYAYLIIKYAGVAKTIVGRKPVLHEKNIHPRADCPFSHNPL